MQQLAVVIAMFGAMFSAAIPCPVPACYLQGRLRWGARLDQRLIGERQHALAGGFPVISLAPLLFSANFPLSR
jgi:hypothetical protein